MSVVYEPTDVHHCVVQFHVVDNGNGTLAFDHAAHFAQPGTVIECDCGATFVAQSWQPGECFPRWRREGWFARRRRRKHQPGAEDRHITEAWESDKLPSAVIAPPDGPA